MDLLAAAILLFLVMDPVGNVPIFITLLKDLPAARRRLTQCVPVRRSSRDAKHSAPLLAISAQSRRSPRQLDAAAGSVERQFVLSAATDRRRRRCLQDRQVLG